jgi:tetratricopeptide (TPR) repeat protein
VLRGLLLGLVLLLVYMPAERGRFLWDDDANVTANPVIASPRGIFRIWSDAHCTQQFYPLTHSSFWLTYQLFGPRPVAFHLINIGLHALSAWLVVVLLFELRAKGAWLCGWLFALHPLQAESVAWITERKNCLAGVLALASTILFFRRERGRSSSLFLAGSFVAFVLALLSKTAVALLPVVMLLLAIARHGRLRRLDALSLVPFFLVGAAFAGITGWFETHHVGASGAEFSWTVSQRLAIALQALVFYPGKLIAPVGLMFFYPRWETSFARPGPWIALLAIATAAALLFSTRRRLGPWPAALAGAYVALIAPALGFVNLYFMRYAFAQNHFAYFAAIPLFALISEAVARNGVIARLAGSVRWGLAVAVFAVLSLLTSEEASAFADTRTLFTRALVDNPDAWMAAHNLAESAEKHGNHEDALRLFDQELRTYPIASSFNDRGVVETELGRWTDAIHDFATARRLDPRNAAFPVNLAMAEERTGHDAAARAHHEEALALSPDSEDIALSLAWLLATSEDDGVRDGARALQLAQATAGGARKARALDVQAAARAEMGDLPAAVTLEDQAIAATRADDPGANVAPFLRRQAEYASGRPHREHHEAPRP